MNNNNTNTKQKILQTALELFSHKGYTAVSIRDIGKVVGIKESSIYYYFKNKQDIFSTLIVEFQQVVNNMTIRFNKRFEEALNIEEAEFIKVGLNVLESFFIDTHIIKFIRMLIIEQHTNEEVAKIYRNILFEGPLKQNEEVFQLMIEKGYFKDDDARSLAIEYYGMIYFIFFRYFSNGQVKPEIKEKAEGELVFLLKRFFRRYRIDNHRHE